MEQLNPKNHITHYFLFMPAGRLEEFAVDRHQLQD
jgi:hypothetical protein